VPDDPANLLKDYTRFLIMYVNPPPDQVNKQHSNTCRDCIAGTLQNLCQLFHMQLGPVQITIYAVLVDAAAPKRPELPRMTPTYTAKAYC
jgi:hypothetical protein